MIDVLDNRVIYAKIDALRQERGWTIYQLAKKASISQTAIRNWRDGNISPSIASLEAVCSAFEISLIGFLTDDEDIAENKELLELWHCLNPSQQKNIINLMKSMK